MDQVVNQPEVVFIVCYYFAFLALASLGGALVSLLVAKLLR